MKVLIVDDEALARESLKMQIKQFTDAHLFEAGDGKTALAVLAKEKPELVFVDIRMPGMSGIEFMEHARKIYSQIFFVVLSGYDSFEYAQKAIRYDAIEYLLKPVNDRDIREVFWKVKEKLLEREQEKEKYEEIYLSERKKKRSLQRKYIYEFLNVKKSRREGIAKKLEDLGVNFDKSYFQVFLIRTGSIAVQAAEEEMLKFGIWNIAQEIFYDDGKIYLFDDINGVGVLFNTALPSGGQVFEQKAEALFEEANKFCEFIGVNKVTIGIGVRKEGVDILDEVYDSARYALNLYLTGGEYRIYFARQSSQSDISGFNRSDWEKRFTKGLLAEDKKAVVECVNDFYAQYLNGNLKSVKELHKLHLSFFVLLLKTVRNYQPDALPEDEFYLYNKIQRLDSIEEMKKYVLDKVEICFRIIENHSISGNKKVVWRGKQFIEENLGNDLKLNATAEYAGVSPVYFSKLFKEEENKNFIDYVTERRMQIACELLEKNMKTAEISERIGYHDMKHFYKVFKKYMGVTPSQYRKKIR